MSGEIARKVIGYFREQTTATAEVDQLTAREREVLDLVVHGLSNKEIAERLGVGAKTVSTYKARLMEKLGTATTHELLEFYRRETAKG